MAFARSPKPVRERNSRHLEFIRLLGCVFCACEGVDSERPSQAMHVSFLADGGKGFGSKAPDRYTVPGCAEHHAEQTNSGLHQVHERVYWARSGLNAKSLCADLYAVSGDVEAGERVIRDHAERAHRMPKVVRGSDLREPADAAPPVVLIRAHRSTTEPADANGNVAVLIPQLGRRGQPPIIAHVDPHSLEQP